LDGTWAASSPVSSVTIYSGDWPNRTRNGQNTVVVV
jgi:hypothetical protein